MRWISSRPRTSRWRAISFFPSASKMQSSIRSAWCDQTAKSAPSAVKVTPPWIAVFAIGSGNHGRLVAACPLAQIGDLVSDGDEVGERFLGVDRMARRVRLVALDIDADRGARGAGAG